MYGKKAARFSSCELEWMGFKKAAQFLHICRIHSAGYQEEAGPIFGGNE
jgi:hypothetical protein